MARSGEYDNMKYLILAVSLFAVGESAVKYTPPTALCEDVIQRWGAQGCVRDSQENCVPFNNNECGWGLRTVNFICRTTELRTCNYFCYKLCPDERVPDCNDVDMADGCDIKYSTPCSAKCGVGKMTVGWVCKGVDEITNCSNECCCDKCKGQGGAGTQAQKVCNDVNMAIPNAEPEEYCPFRTFTTPSSGDNVLK